MTATGAARMRRLKSDTEEGGASSSSWLKGGMPARSATSMFTSGGASSTAPRSRAVLKDALRKLPEMPKDAQSHKPIVGGREDCSSGDCVSSTRKILRDRPLG